MVFCKLCLAEFILRKRRTSYCQHFYNSYAICPVLYIIIKEVNRNEKNLSTEKAPQKDGTRFPQENGYKERPQGSRSQKSKGMPGDNVRMTIKLITPIAIEQGLRFAIREGGRTVGSGVVSSIIE